MAVRYFRRQESKKVVWDAANEDGIEAFKQFYDCEYLEETLQLFNRVCEGAKLPRGGRYTEFFPYLKAAYKDALPYKYKEIFKILEKKAAQSLYESNTVGQTEKNRVLVVGAGPVGLRSAIEVQLLGARVVVVERRPKFTRNNVLKLWKFLIDDLKSLGAKKFYGKFATGSINHINIRSLQLILTKISLMLGITVYSPCKFDGISEPVLTEEGSLISGWKAKFSEGVSELVESFIFDVIIGASGKNCVLDGFSRYSLDARLAIAITANFVNHGTSAEQAVEEIGGLGRQFDQDFFKDMCTETGVDLENIVYYKDQVHYFVMTAKKESLLAQGVLKEDLQDDEETRGRVLHPSNIDKEKLMEYATKAALYATEHRSQKLPHTEWAMIPRGDKGSPDCCIFDFTNLYAARVAARVTVRKGQPLLATIVGDSLLEPFWPEGTGCARGFLSALDAGWMIRDWFLAKKNPIKILAEREMTRSILNQTTDGNLVKKFKDFTIDPKSRYITIPTKYDKDKILKYYDSDNPDEIQFLTDRFKEKRFFDNAQHKSILKKFRSTFKKTKKTKEAVTAGSAPLSPTVEAPPPSFKV
jgi:hypothetical protein